MTKHVWLSGGNGFVGSHVVRHLLRNTTWNITLPVSHRYAGNNDRVYVAAQGIPGALDRLNFVRCDLTEPFSKTTRARFEKFGPVEEIWNIASVSDVDLSIDQPSEVIRDNVSLIINVLDYARSLPELDIFLQMSTDETLGPAPAGYAHREWDTVKPSNPYSASKAAQEAIAFSYWRTYAVPVVITNTMNIIGETQDPAKFVPKTMKKLLAGEPMTVHVSPRGESGSRYYLHARNLADAWLHLSRLFDSVDVATYPYQELPDRFHIVGEREVSNMEMVQMIADILEVPARMEPVNFHESRPGHDLRYALDGSKIAEYGWRMPIPLEESLSKTVLWTRDHPEWLL